MGDDWRVRIAFDEDDPPELPESGEQALVAALRSRLSDQVAVTSNGTEIFLYAPPPDRLMRPHKWRVRCLRGTTSARPSGRSSGAH